MDELIEETRTLDKHFTVSGYVLSPDHRKLLLVWHKKLGGWLPPGGHLEDNEIPHEAVLREVFEETGVHAKCVETDAINLGLRGVVDTAIPVPFALSYQLISENASDPEHIHLDMAFLLQASATSTPLAAIHEVADVRWYSRAEIKALEGAFDSVRGFARSYMSD